MLIKGLCIILTDKCNASCQICCFGCQPENHQVIDEETMLNIIRQAAGLTSIKYIGFSGGEPFLYYDLLQKGINYAKDLGFKTSVVTNGFWGKWPQHVIVSKLSGLKLDKLFISSDHFHSQFVPLGILEQAIITAKTQGIDIELGIGEMKSGKSSGEYFQELGDYKYLMKVYTYPFVRAGRAEELPYEDFYRLTDSTNLRCRSNGLVSVRYDGEVFPCCEQMVFDTTLSLGNIKQNSLDEILSDKDYTAITSVLMSKGFDRIAEAARMKFKIDIPKLCVNSCEICHILFENQDISRKLKPYIDEEYDKMVVTKLLSRSCL